jgi:hypothetical protein
MSLKGFEIAITITATPYRVFHDNLPIPDSHIVLFLYWSHRGFTVLLCYCGALWFQKHVMTHVYLKRMGSRRWLVFWVVVPCSLVEVYQRFRGPCCFHHQGYRPDNRRQPSLYSQPREPQILNIRSCFRTTQNNKLNCYYICVLKRKPDDEIKISLNAVNITPARITNFTSN